MKKVTSQKQIIAMIRDGFTLTLTGYANREAQIAKTTEGQWPIIKPVDRTTVSKMIENGTLFRVGETLEYRL